MKNSGSSGSSGMSNSATPGTTFSLFRSVVQKADKERYIDGSDWSVAKAMLSASGFTVYHCAIRSSRVEEKTTIFEIDLWSTLLSFADCFRWAYVQWTFAVSLARAPTTQTTNGDECRQRVHVRAVFRRSFRFSFELWREKIEKHLYFIGNRFVSFF